MIDYDKIVSHKRKVIEVIESCETISQLKVAERYKQNFIQYICSPMLNNYTIWDSKFKDYYIMFENIEHSLNQYCKFRKIQIKNQKL